MANIVDTTINIGGETLSFYRIINIHQQIFGHDSFTLTLPTEYVDGKEGQLFQKSKDFIGKDFTVQTGLLGGEGKLLQFTGIITKIHRSRDNGYHGDIIISGYAPTILLDSGPHCKSWQKQTMKSIIEDVLKYFPANKLNAQINPLYSTPIDYVVQYQETAWEFIQRMCATYGEWLYYTGSELVIGARKSGETKELTFGSDLSHFDIGMSIKPANKKVMSYDYANTAVYSGNPGSVAQKAGLDELGNHAYQVSQSVYATTPKAWNNGNMTASGHLNDAIDMRSAMTGSSLVILEGVGTNPATKIGGGIHIKGSNVYSFAKEDYGSYIPIEIDHELRINNSYSNTFSAVPATIKVPPIEEQANPRCETQSAIVTSNNDPQGLGRIQVKFHWMSGAETTPWIRVTTPHAGGGKGMYFIPEVGEEVIVGFEGDSAIKPYVIGAVYNSKSKNAFGNAGNDVKALQSRSGNKVVLNDSVGSVFVEDMDGNSMLMDGVGNVTLKSNESITLVCGDSMLNMKKDGTIVFSGKDIFTSATNDIGSNAKNQVAIVADVDFIAYGKATAALASNKTTVSGDSEVGVFSKKLQAVGSTETTINGGKVDVASAGNVSVNGAIVKLNS